MAGQGYRAVYTDLPETVGGLETRKYVPPHYFERVYPEDEQRRLPSFTVRIELTPVTKLRYEIEPYLKRTFSHLGVEPERHAPLTDWLKENKDTFLDIITVQIWSRFSPANYLQAADELIVANTAQELIQNLKKRGVPQVVEQVAELTSQKVSLPDLQTALGNRKASPLVIYYQTILDLNLTQENEEPEFGEPLKFRATVTNKSAFPFDRKSLTIHTSSESYKSAKDWVVDKQTESGDLEKGDTMAGTITLDPIPEKLDTDKLEGDLKFSLRSSADQELDTKTIHVATKPFVISPTLQLDNAPKYKHKGTQIKVNVNIPKEKEVCASLAVKVRMLASPDFKLDYPSNGEFTTKTGPDQTSFYVTPTRAGLPGYKNEMNLAYYFGDKQLRTKKATIERDRVDKRKKPKKMDGTKLVLTVLPNVTDSVATGITALGGILSAVHVIPNPSGDLATTLPSLGIGALALYLGLRAASWTIKTQNTTTSATG